jgi:hypothetical protein
MAAVTVVLERIVCRDGDPPTVSLWRSVRAGGDTIT